MAAQIAKMQGKISSLQYLLNFHLDKHMVVWVDIRTEIGQSADIRTVWLKPQIQSEHHNHLNPK